MLEHTHTHFRSLKGREENTLTYFYTARLAVSGAVNSRLGEAGLPSLKRQTQLAQRDATADITKV